MVEKFNGFTIVRVENDRSAREKFYRIDIIYRPVKNWLDEIIQCYFLIEMHLAYMGLFNNGDKIEYSTASQCFYCSNFYGRKDKCDIHVTNCTGQPGINCDFSMQNLVAFEGILKYEGDLPLTVYIDFEKTAPTDSLFSEILYSQEYLLMAVSDKNICDK